MLKEQRLYQVVKLESTNGMVAPAENLANRRLGLVRALRRLPGHGGDVWVCQNQDEEESLAPYSYTELEKVR